MLNVEHILLADERIVPELPCTVMPTPAPDTVTPYSPASDARQDVDSLDKLANADEHWAAFVYVVGMYMKGYSPGTVDPATTPVKTELADWNVVVVVDKLLELVLPVDVIVFPPPTTPVQNALMGQHATLLSASCAQFEFEGQQRLFEPSEEHRL